jgi:Bromodomain
MEELQAARKVVKDVLKNKSARALFGEPVDTSVHHTYCKVIKKPMDLGTILSRLTAGENGSRGRDKGLYKTVKEVLRDVNLVWNNCLEYNCQPEDQETRKLCNEVRKQFESKWQAAGLLLDASKEKQIGTGPKRGKAATVPERLEDNDKGAGVPSAYYITPGSNLSVCDC